MLDVADVAVSYAGAVSALSGVSITVPDGDIVAVLGGNGAGKTTLLRAISGTLSMHRARLTAGTITLDGKSLVGRDPADVVRMGVVHVPEGRRVFGRLTVEENLRAGAMAVRDRVARAQATRRVFDLFPRLAERRTARAVLLSGGEQQMLAIGRGLMSSPKVLLLDEPSLGLAPRVVGQIGEVIAEINRQGTAVVLVEQNASMALSVARGAVVLTLGRTTLAGPATELAGSDDVARLYLARDDSGPGEATPPTAGGGTEAGTASTAPPTLSPWVEPPRRRAWSAR